jgi:glutaminyl-peptide cyclotransferase
VRRRAPGPRGLALTAAAVVLWAGSTAPRIGAAQGVDGGAEGGVQRLTVRVVGERSHDPGAYTQGLLWHAGALYESTGQYGQSTLRRVDPATGVVERSRALPESEFGEGLARVGERLVQLTWTSGVAHVWDLETFDLVKSLRYEGEGWGLCSDGTTLFMSDGSSTITRRDPETFTVTGTFEVSLDGRPIASLNELEHAEGWLYANIYQTDWIARIDTGSGEVVALIDASSLRSRLGVAPASVDVLNGIAYLPESATFLLTGKYWPKLFEVIFVE